MFLFKSKTLVPTIALVGSLAAIDYVNRPRAVWKWQIVNGSKISMAPTSTVIGPFTRKWPNGLMIVPGFGESSFSVQPPYSSKPWKAKWSMEVHGSYLNQYMTQSSKPLLKYSGFLEFTTQDVQVFSKYNPENDQNCVKTSNPDGTINPDGCTRNHKCRYGPEQENRKLAYYETVDRMQKATKNIDDLVKQHF